MNTTLQHLSRCFIENFWLMRVFTIRFKVSLLHFFCVHLYVSSKRKLLRLRYTVNIYRSSFVFLSFPLLHLDLISYGLKEEN